MNSKFSKAPRIIISDNKPNSDNKINKKISDEVKKPFCKVCYDAKQAGYDTHYLRSGDNVACPYLLSLECGYCHDMGHTVKYCPVLKKNQDMSSHEGNPPRHKNRIYNEISSDGWTVRARAHVPGKFLIIGLEDENKKKTGEQMTISNHYVVLESATMTKPESNAQVLPEAQEFPMLSVPAPIPEYISASSRSWADIAAANTTKFK